MPEHAPPPSTLAGLSLAEIAAFLAARPTPPLERWHPPHCGDSGISISRDGRWWHAGSVIERPAMVRLFASVLRRADDGGFELVTPVERLTVTVEDTPFVAVEVSSEGEGVHRRLAFRLSTDEPVVAGAAHPLRLEDDGGRQAPLLGVRPGLDARIARPVFYELAELAIGDGGDPAGVWSDGAFFPLVAP